MERTERPGVYRTCDGVSRRDVLKVGMLGVLGGLSMTDLFMLQARAGQAGAEAESVVLIWMGGGPSHIDTWDPKPEAPAEIRGLFNPIATSVPSTSHVLFAVCHSAKGTRSSI